MQYLKSVFIILTVVLVSSCSVTYLSVTDEIIPPKIAFPNNIQSIILLNRSLENSLGQRISSGVIYNPEHKELMRYVANKLPIRAQSHNKTLRDSKSGEPSPPLQSNKVKDYGAGYDGLLCLEQLYQFEQRTYHEFEKHQLDEQGKDYYVDAVKGTKTNILNAVWRLYDVKNGKIILEIPYQLEINNEAVGLSQQNVNVKLDTLQIAEIDKLNYTIADKFIRDLSPTKIESNWKYYKKGNEDIKKTAEYFKKKQYSFVIQTLERNLNKYSSKEKLKAMYNLATAHFLNGNYDEAIKVARQGNKMTNKSDFKNLINKMNQH